MVFTFNYAKAHRDFPVGFDIYDADKDAGSIVDAVAVDDHTVRFDLNKPDSLARLNIGPVFPLPEHIWKDVADPLNYANPKIVATGPFTEVRDFSRNSFKLCRNPLYRERRQGQDRLHRIPAALRQPAGHRRHHQWRSRLGDRRHHRSRR